MIEEILNKYVQKHSIDPIKHNKIAVAYSGGSDSTALLIAMQKTLTQHRVYALTVDHKLRPESGAEAASIRHLAHNHVILACEKKPIASNIQAYARNLRYRLMFDWCMQNNVRYIFFGHHAGDQIESFYLAAAAGAGVFGLSGMREMHNIHKINMCRPFLRVPKDALREYLIHNNVSWVEDPTNEKNIYKRNEIRSQILCTTGPHAPADASANILNTMRLLGRSRDFIETYCSEMFQQCATYCWYGGYEINYNIFQTLHIEIQIRLIKTIIIKMKQSTRPAEAGESWAGSNADFNFGNRLIRTRQLEEFLAKIGSNIAVNHTMSGLMFLKTKSKITVIEEPNLCQARSAILSPGGSYRWNSALNITNERDCTVQIRGIDHKLWQEIVKGNAALKGVKLNRNIIYSLPVAICQNGMYLPFLGDLA